MHSVDAIFREILSTEASYNYNYNYNDLFQLIYVFYKLEDVFR